MSPDVNAACGPPGRLRPVRACRGSSHAALQKSKDNPDAVALFLTQIRQQPLLTRLMLLQASRAHPIVT